MERIRVAIVGYGNLGRGVEKAIKKPGYGVNCCL